ncbi:hypothetical protein DAPPUDRAFT_98703 [Daphnia pulex]|uniref:Secreted protein n=1 Tax=Daphnia pulex TaxID=6669 RepID=E9G5K5_DAPPU|nr:hypothetical protein DAPPUDRAFT_98703 [Daphnia pulex]|eukprot:EFX85613.1 hypothetical protein DAPPUDRAFT_98703 [Daphnia pulex]
MELAQVAVLLAFCDVLISVWKNSSGLWGIVTHTRDNLAVNIYRSASLSRQNMSFSLEGHKEHYYVKLACGGVEVGPIPSNFILQKERPVCISIEGHGDHYVKRVMQWCRGWVRTGRFSSLSRSELWRRSAVGYRCVDHWCTDVSWAWRIPNRNAAVLLPNNIKRNDQFTTPRPPSITLLLASQLLPEASDYIKVPEH